MGVFAGTAADRGTGAAVAATAAVAGLAGLWYMTATTSSHSPPQQSSTTPTPTPTTRTNVTPSPLTTQIPHLTPAQAAALPYPPGSATTATTTTTTTENLAAALPGGRDVPTAYGSIRVYEWGPEDPAAEKVLLVHGISTPCIALGDLAWELVGKGCRVMLFDLFGRGYSDAPNDIPYDARLYTTQMLLVLASSELSWLSNGGGGFHLVGYSFGGCLCVAFAAQFPHLLRSLNLVATSGLMRPHHVGRSSRWLYESRILPEWLVRAMVRRRIRPPLPSSTAAAAVAVAGPRGTSEGKADSSTSSANASEPKVLLLSEATNQTPPPSLPSSSSPGTSDGQSHGRRSTSTEPAKATTISRNGDASGGAAFDSASLSRSRPDVTVSSVVRWQVDHHAGFVGAFLSTIRESPIYAPSGDADWRALRRILSAGGGGSSGSGGSSKVSRQQKEEAVDIVGDGVSAAPAAAAAAGMGAAAGRAGRGGLAAKGKILIVLGGKDSVIDCAETVADATAILNGDDDDADANGGRGEESSSPASRVEFVILEDVGHEIPITSSAEVADALVGHWREVTVMGTAKRSV